MERGELELPDWNVALQEQQDSFDCSPVKQPLVQVRRPLRAARQPEAVTRPRQPLTKTSHGSLQRLTPAWRTTHIPHRSSLRMATDSASPPSVAPRAKLPQVRSLLVLAFSCAAASYRILHFW